MAHTWQTKQFDDGLHMAKVLEDILALICYEVKTTQANPNREKVDLGTVVEMVRYSIFQNPAVAVGLDLEEIMIEEPSNRYGARTHDKVFSEEQNGKTVVVVEFSITKEHPLAKMVTRWYDISIKVPLLEIKRKQLIDINGASHGFYISEIKSSSECKLAKCSIKLLPRSLNIELWKSEREYLQALEWINQKLEDFTPDELDALFANFSKIAIIQSPHFISEKNSMLSNYSMQDEILRKWRAFRDANPEVMSD